VAKVLGGFFAPKIKPFFRVLGVSVILAAAWYGFLALVPRPPISTTPVLIMIWSSVVVLLLALFPRIFERVKRFKVKDFEIELQETIARSAPEDYISLADLDDYTFTQKGDFRNLDDILERVIREPSKPILLVANLKHGSYISIPMLFIYLFFLDMIGKSLTVLFISTREGVREIADIARDSIVGAVSGRTVLQTFYGRFPHLSRILEVGSAAQVRFGDLLAGGHVRGGPMESLFRRVYDDLREFHSNQREYLTERDVRNWFRGELSCRTVEVSVSSQDLRSIRQALIRGDEFILAIEDESLRSVMSLSCFSKNLARKVLADIAEP
jgi:hypothetical protein